ncbi:hypothetical protein HDU86_006648 [Geranomyces michiganensis]|nr:hypothetical protein HDU86_006648 [Geranomyces michiganensis]
MTPAGANNVPALAVRWFHAVDVPKSDDTPFRVATTANTPKVPATWKTFSARDSANLEAAYQLTKGRQDGAATSTTHSTTNSSDNVNDTARHNTSPRSLKGLPSSKVPVNEDQLFEADVERLETHPVYWHGPTYDIRRGTWFYAAFGGSYLPCDENLSRQLEDGYRKFQPWATSGGTSSSSAAASASAASPATSMSSGPPPKPLQGHQEQRWALFGPYMNQYVIYEGAHTAIQFSDDFGSKIGRAVMNIGGTRLTRGWDEVEKLRTKNKAQLAKEEERKKAREAASSSMKSKSSDAAATPSATPKAGVETDAAQKVTNSLTSLLPDLSSSAGKLNEEAAKIQEKTETEDYDEEEDGDRPINHLVLVIHGIGQKLGERVEAVNFIHDCNILRRTIKESSQQYATAKDQLKFSKRAGLINMPEDGGVQILPVQWRQKIKFGLARQGTAAAAAAAAPSSSSSSDSKGKDEAEADAAAEMEATLDDITLEGVPSIRQLVSDVVLDVLLYMSPRYRQEMIKHVTEELNRIYRLFKQRNPKFNGKVSVLGHSLGSLLSFDILCNQPLKPGSSAPPTIDLSSPDGSLSSPRRPQEVDLTDLLHGATSADDRKVNGIMERSNMSYGTLEFEVDRLFVVGSPVGLFLLLKGDKMQARKPRSSAHPLEGVSCPAVNAFYNIFHPHDPVAYRIEPCISREFSEQKPVPIPYTKGGLKGTIVGIQDIGNGIADRGRSMFEAASRGITSTKAVVTSGISTSMGRAVTMLSSINAFKAAPAHAVDFLDEKAGGPAMRDHGVELSGSRNGGSAEGSSHEMLESGSSAVSSVPPVATIGGHAPSVEMREIVRPSHEGATDVELLNPRGRIDYVLQEGVLENPYISALGVHMNYWGDPDCALFMLRELYCEINPEDRKSLGRGGGGGGGGGSGEGPKDFKKPPHDGGGSDGPPGRGTSTASGTTGTETRAPGSSSGTNPATSGLTASLVETTQRLVSALPVDEFGRVVRDGLEGLALPFEFDSRSSGFELGSGLDGFALLHIVVSLITNLILTGLSLIRLLVFPIWSKP